MIAALLFSSACHAADTSIIANKALSGDEITLNDGRIVRLANIKALSSDARGFLESLLHGQALNLQNLVTDRYGRVEATVFVQGQKQTVEDALLQAGMAFVYPATGDDPQLDNLLKTERTARAKKTGYWETHPDTPSDDAEKLYGQYGFVIGTVTKAERIKNKVYLNFGADWHNDFTVAIAAHDIRAFKKQDIDLLTLQGKTVRVRGWVKRDFGPMITITDPHQIEFTPSPS